MSHNYDMLGDIAILLADANARVTHGIPLPQPADEARERMVRHLGVNRDDETPAEIRAKLSTRLDFADQDWPPDLSDPNVKRGRDAALEEDDPEMLTTVDRIYYAAWLLRQNHPRVTDDDYMLWGNLADTLEHAASIPRRTMTPMPWREFNRAGDLATGIIRTQDNHQPTRAKLLRWVIKLGSVS